MTVLVSLYEVVQIDSENLFTELSSYLFRELSKAISNTSSEQV